MSRQPELIVWGTGTSRTLRVHWMLAELNLEYDNKKVGPRTGETQTEAYKAINPKGKIPFWSTVISLSQRVLPLLDTFVERLRGLRSISIN